MLQSIKHILNKKTIILGSSSPRRCDILRKSLPYRQATCGVIHFPLKVHKGLNFEVFPSNIDENLDKNLYSDLFKYAEDLAKMKTSHVLHQLLEFNKSVDLVIGADTIIIHENKIFGKPIDREDAFRILSALSGKSHEVVTAVCIGWCSAPTKNFADYKMETFHETTKVNMADLDPTIIDAYVATDEPMDKAGAYGIQDFGCSLVTGIEGDYFNVVGLPIHQVSNRLYRLCKDGQFEDSL